MNPVKKAKKHYTSKLEQKLHQESLIDEIQNATNNRQGALACTTLNDICSRKIVLKIKMKAKSEMARLGMWKEHFQYLLGNQTTFDNQLTKKILRHLMKSWKANSFKMSPTTRHQVLIILQWMFGNEDSSTKNCSTSAMKFIIKNQLEDG